MLVALVPKVFRMVMTVFLVTVFGRDSGDNGDHDRDGGGTVVRVVNWW